MDYPAVGGFALRRLVISQRLPGFDEVDPEPWQLQLVGYNDVQGHRQLHFDGQIMASSSHFLVIANVFCVLTLTDSIPLPTSADEEDKALVSFAPLVSHAIWDFGAAIIRGCSGAMFSPRPELPQATPAPKLVTNAMMAVDVIDEPDE